MLRTTVNKMLPASNARNNFILYYLNAVTNRVNQNRIKEIGPDSAAAEWLIRNGSSVRWKNSSAFSSDFAQLPKSDFFRHKLEEIDARNSSLMDLGFEHLDTLAGLDELRRVTITNNSYLGDEALRLLSLVSDSLIYLQIESCPKITGDGIRQLANLKNLQELRLSDLKSIDGKEELLEYLRKKLPSCKISWD